MEIILTTITSWVTGIVGKIGYWGIMGLMTIESSFIPFPSEVIVPPAAYLAQQGQMNIYLVILAGIMGSLLGALINYYLALFLGRKIIYTFINNKKLDKAEKYFLKYGNVSTLIGRLVPVIRQLISIPAGFSKMKLKSFIFYTFLGSGIWVIILAILGYSFGSNQEVLEKYYSQISLFFIVLAIILATVIIIKKQKSWIKKH